MVSEHCEFIHMRAGKQFDQSRVDFGTLQIRDHAGRKAVMPGGRATLIRAAIDAAFLSPLRCVA
jgi:hypothetical protein